MDGDGADSPEVQQWLGWLRDGSVTQKVTARRGLAHVFEQRGMRKEAIELLENNVRAGVRSSEEFRWLARLYHEQGDETRSVEALAEAARYQPAAFTSVAAAPRELPTDVTPTRTLRTLAPYLLLVVGLGITIGVVPWLVAPLLRP